MKSQKSRQIVVAITMAGVVGVAAVIFALRSSPVASVAQSAAPPTPLSQNPAAPAAIAPIPDALAAAVAQIPDAPAALAHNDNVATKGASTTTPSTAEPKRARSRDLAQATANAVAPDDVVARAAPVADATVKPVAEPIASSVDSMKSATELTPATPTSIADEPKVGASTEIPASDSQITSDVKSEIAVDSLTKDVTIGVTTTAGVVALSGNLANQDAIDHVKDAVGKVKDVKSVDTSALIVASL
jgi:hyperosmotically inducible protein